MSKLSLIKRNKNNHFRKNLHFDEEILGENTAVKNQRVKTVVVLVRVVD